MNCKQIEEFLPDLASGLEVASPGVNSHIQACDGCAVKLAEIHQTMALLDEWQAPEPSPYFNTRLEARLREEARRPAAGWMQWLRRPVLAASLMALMVVGGSLIGKNSFSKLTGKSTPTAPLVEAQKMEPGTPVGDLQALDKNNELYADFDVLDELQVQSEVRANP